MIGGKYRLTRLLRQRRAGEIWAAVDTTAASEITLEIPPKSGEEDLRLQLLHQALIEGKLGHRNLIDLHDVAETDKGEPFLVSRLLSGETLSELLARQRRLVGQRAAQIGLAVADALSCAHAAGVVHLDLDPECIFLVRADGDNGADVKVLGFGVSRSLAACDRPSTAGGGCARPTPYASPEQASGEPRVDHRADLWSLGVIMFEMLTGKRPFTGDAQSIVTGRIPPVTSVVRSVDPRLSELVSRCLERDVERRIESAEALARQLQPFAGPGELPTELMEIAPEPPAIASNWASSLCTKTTRPGRCAPSVVHASDMELGSGRGRSRKLATYLARRLATFAGATASNRA